MKEPELTPLEKKIGKALIETDPNIVDGSDEGTKRMLERITNVCIQEQIELLTELSERLFDITPRDSTRLDRAIENLKSQLK